MPRLEFSVLGPLAARRDGASLPLGGGKRALLLAVLVIEAGRPVARDRLIDELWGEEPPETAVTALHGLVSQLRRLLEDEEAIRSGTWQVLVGRGSGYCLVAPDESIDVHRFLARLASAKDARDRGDHAASLAAVDEALALWRGNPLLGFSSAEIDAFAHRCEDARLDALEDRADALLGLGRPREALVEVERLIESHPERERLRATQVVALYRCGRQVDALNALASARRRLRDDLGLAPSPALDDLERRILNHDSALGAAEPPADAPDRRSRTRIAVAGAAAVVLALAALAVAVLRDDSSPSTVASGSGDRVVAIDATSRHILASYAVGAGAVGLTSDSDAVWTLNADDGTLTRIDLRRRSTHTIGTGTTPVDLAAGGGGLWTANGSRTNAQFVGPVVTAVSKLDPKSGTTLRTTALLRSRALTSNAGRQHIVATSAGVFVIGADFAISRLDPETGAIAARSSGVRAIAVAFGPLGLWALEPTGLVHLDPASVRVVDRVPLAGTNLERLAVGAGSVWITDSAAGTLWRVDPSGPEASARTLELDPGIDAVIVSNGSVWVTNPERRELLRVDPRRNAIVSRMHFDGPPLGMTAAGQLVWVTLGQSAPAADALAASCGPVIYGGSGRPDTIIVSDLPMGASPRLPPREMSDAIAFVLRAHHYRAGGRTVGYRACDDWSGATALSDPARCHSNGQAYGRSSSVLAVIGPYNSSCALELIPAADAAPGGPLLVISPAATSTGLTRPGVTTPSGLPRSLYPAGVRNFVRLRPTDDDEGAALASEAKALGARRVDVLTTGSFGETTRRAFDAAAKRLGLDVVGTYPYDPSAPGYAALARRTERDRPDAVLVSALLDEGAGALIRALRQRLGGRVAIIGSAGLLPISALFTDAGPAARGVHVSLPGLDANHLGAGGRAFEHAFGATRQAPVSQAAVYAAAATELVLTAIARSDGTRSGVLAALRRERSPGILGPVRIDANGDAHPPQVTIVRAVRPGGSDAIESLDGSVWERVVST